ncbi:hypothetical protein Q7P37_000205 [Cladosporium fusiforme]
MNDDLKTQLGGGAGEKQHDGLEKMTQAESAQRPFSPANARSSLEYKSSSVPFNRGKADHQLPRHQSTTSPSNTNDSGTARPKSQQPPGPSAAAISAVMATSSSENDKMHSKKREKKVDDWSEDSTYKGKLARMTGSTRKWNYFGADIGENPFKRFGRKK